jgi:uncharacterized protein
VQGVGDQEHALYVLLFCALLGALFGSARHPALGFLTGGGASGLLCVLLLGSPTLGLLAAGLGGILGLTGPALPGGIGSKRRHPGGFGHGPFSGGGFGGGFSGGHDPAGSGGARGRW